MVDDALVVVFAVVVDADDVVVGGAVDEVVVGGAVDDVVVGGAVCVLVFDV